MTNEFLALYAAAVPEMIVGAGICIVLLAGLFAGARSREVVYLLAMATLVAGAWAVGAGDPAGTMEMPGGALVLDPLARLLKLFVFAVAAVVFVYSRTYLRERALDAADFYVLSLFAILGVMVMISAASFLTMYLGLETLSLALYAMVAFRRDSAIGAEAAMKYFVLGAIASGCLLYGISIIYGVTGNIEFSQIAAVLGAAQGGQAAAPVGLSFILVGVAFKFGAVPFHMWVPDVYQGAPTCVTLFVATIPKLAAFALTLRILLDGLGPLQPDWQLLVAGLAVLSLAIGNLVAIVQTSIKRMLAYSAIAHVGFILLGFVAGGSQGVESALFYTLVYVIMTAAAFGVVLLLSTSAGDADTLDDFKGLNKRSPWFALLMMLVMISMIGVPPLAGFYAKWWILSALIEAGQAWLALVGVVFSVIGAFYYLRIIRLMYFEEGTISLPLQQAFDLRLLLGVNVLLVLALGLFPARLLELCARAMM